MKIIYTFLLIFLFSMGCLFSETPNLTGHGTEESPYQVSSAADLNEVRKCLDCYYEQTGPINLDIYTNWEPIAGNGTDERFTGHYDGNGNTISNLKINRPNVSNVGLFGHVGINDNGQTTLRNIKLQNVKVTGGRGTGALVGRVTGNQNTRIEYCSVNEGEVKGNAVVGGLVGSNNSYRLNNANAESFRPVIHACWANVDVSMVPNSDPNKIQYGGLAGCNQKGLISNSYALGNVTAGAGADRIGGLTGCVEYRGIIINSFAMGMVSGPDTETKMGGLLGFGGENQYSGTVMSSYFLSDQPINGEGVALSGAQMKIQSNFEDWDFANIWIMGTDNPTLRENPPVSTNIWTWSGGVSVSWNNAANWEGEGNDVPPTDEQAVVVIPAGEKYWPVINEDIVLQDLLMGTGAKITLVGSSLSISGILKFDGDSQQPAEILTPDNGRLILAGQNTQQIPPMIFNNLIIENPNNASLAGDITVKGNLKMELGFLDLNGFEITLAGEVARLFEKENVSTSSRVFGASGTITTVQTIIGNDLNIAGIGLGLNTNKTMEVTIERGHSELAGSDEAKSIMRWFTITPTILPADLKATVTFHYFLGELQKSDANPALSLFKRVKDEEIWQPWESVYSHSENKKLVAENVTSFSQWTASDASTPMPIVLLSFEGKAVEDALALSWVTATELNNDYFTIERSRDGAQFNSLGTKTGAGTTSQMNNYKYMDNEPLDGVAYYRLKQTDFNGDFEYSKIISVYTRTVIAKDIRLFPNPNNGHFRILTGGDKHMNFQIYDMLGKMVYSKNAAPGKVTFVNLSGLQKGIYTVVFYGDEVIARKIQVY